MTVRPLAVSLVILVVVAPACTAGSDAESQGESTGTQVTTSAPAERGGYVGHEAKVFDAAITLSQDWLPACDAVTV
jgi:hypothetical protein